MTESSRRERSRGWRSHGPALISSALVLPFVALELVNRRSFPGGFPIVLFTLMWLLATAFVMVLAPVARSAHGANGILANPLDLLIRAALLILIAALWIGMVVDQMPCFLGVPNCD